MPLFRRLQMKLTGTKTEKNLKDAFAGESQANRRYLYFAAKADVEGFNDVSAVFRSTAEGETGHAHGHLEYLGPGGDPPRPWFSKSAGQPVILHRGRQAHRTRAPSLEPAASSSGEKIRVRRTH